MKDNDKGLWDEVAEHDAIQTAQLNHSVDHQYVLAMGYHAGCDVNGPAQTKQQHAERDGSGLVVVLGQVCSHVGETEAEATENKHEECTKHRSNQISYRTD